MEKWKKWEKFPYLSELEVTKFKVKFRSLVKSNKIIITLLAY